MLTRIVATVNLLGNYSKFPMGKNHSKTQDLAELSWLKKAYDAGQFTLRGLAKAMKVDHKTIHNYITGKTPIPANRVTQIANLILEPGQRKQFLEAWRKNTLLRKESYGGRIRRSRLKKAAVDNGFRASVTVWNQVSLNPDYNSILPVYKNILRGELDSQYGLYGLIDFRIKRRPPTVFLEIFQDLSEGTLRVLNIDLKKGLVFFNDLVLWDGSRNDGETELYGSLHDWKIPIESLTKYCQEVGVDCRALLAMCLDAVQTSTDLDATNYGEGIRIVLEKDRINEMTNFLDAQVKELKEKRVISDQQRMYLINSLTQYSSLFQSFVYNQQSIKKIRNTLISMLNKQLAILDW